jgi:hypothetical protein
MRRLPSEVQGEERCESLENICEIRFRGDFDELNRIKQWLDEHPNREILLQYLNYPESYRV